MSSTALASSLASFSHSPVRSSDLSFFTSAGRSRLRNITSSSMKVPSGSFRVTMLVMGESYLTGAFVQSSQVLIVVLFSSG